MFSSDGSAVGHGRLGSGSDLSTLFDCETSSTVLADSECGSAWTATPSSSFVMPSDPEALAGLLNSLQARFPSLTIPPELRDVAPVFERKAPLSGPQITPQQTQYTPETTPDAAAAQQQQQTVTETTLATLQQQFSQPYVPVVPRGRIESSVDLDSPRRCPEDLEGAAAALQAQISQALDDTKPPDPSATLPQVPWTRRAAPPTPSPQALPHPPPPPCRSPPPASAPPAAVLSPRHNFYNQLGRKLTELLLDAGTSLPRFPTPPQEEQKDPAGAEEGTGDLVKARTAAEMFLKDYKDHKAALVEAEQRLGASENENLALRSQLDLSMVKMISAQKEVDKYATYFTKCRPTASATNEEESQVKTLLKRMQVLSADLQKAHEEKAQVLRDQQTKIDEAVSKALAGRDEEVLRLKTQLKERKKVIKDMKLMLHSYLANNDPTDTNPKMAFLDMIAASNKQQAKVGAGAAF